MDIGSIGINPQQIDRQTDSRESREEEIATRFEKIFARKLVSELTKESFEMGDNSGPLGRSNNLYRHHIVDTLANEIAEQRKLGMAELITKYKVSL